MDTSTRRVMRHGATTCARRVNFVPPQASAQSWDTTCEATDPRDYSRSRTLHVHANHHGRHPLQKAGNLQLGTCQREEQQGYDTRPDVQLVSSPVCHETSRRGRRDQSPRCTPEAAPPRRLFPAMHKCTPTPSLESTSGKGG